LAGWDSRVFAVSPRARAFLASLQVWHDLDARRLARIRRMLVFGDSGSRLEFSAYDTGVSELAWMVEAGAIARALWARLEGQKNLELVSPAQPAGLEFGDAACLTLDSGRSMEARLVVGADGANSFVRCESGLQAQGIPYGHLGVVANFDCGRDHRETAFQWFRSDGVLAWLPLPGRRMSMVWSTPEAHARELLDLPEREFCRRVSDSGASSLGELGLLTPPAAFSIAGLKLARTIAPRVALIGDAAHVVHPLAGQGVNLGFADAQALAKMLAAARHREDIGGLPLLRRYERSRSEDILAMRWATDGLARLFKAPGWRGLRNWGLNSFDRAPVIKSLLARHALG
jgi:ubiquinone biosynthesis UbiH/UbiF/VisC/COQ6 family hydroxylase